MAFLQVNQDGFKRALELAGSTRSLAKLIEVDQATLVRVLQGGTHPSGRFIAGVVANLGGEWFDNLFTVMKEPAMPSPMRKPVRR